MKQKLTFTKITVAGLLIIIGLGGPALVRADDGDNAPPTNISQVQVTNPPAATTTEMTTTTKSGYEPFHALQLSLEAFGTYADRDRRGTSVNHGGGGLGLTFFITHYLGISADSYLEEWKWPYRVNGSGILRLPLPDRFSPVAVYGFGGGGREFKDVVQYTYHGGAGLEFKCCPVLGLFVDGRRVFPDRTPDYTLVRAGVSIGF